MISKSVPQIATASMRTRTSAFFGAGTGLSFSVSSPGSPSTQAFIVSGIGKSGLVFTPSGIAMVNLLEVRCLGVPPRVSAEMGDPQAVAYAFGALRHRLGDMGAIFLARAASGDRDADRAGDGAGPVAQRRAVADHVRLELAVVDGIAHAAHEPELLDEAREGGDSVLGIGGQAVDR